MSVVIGALESLTGSPGPAAAEPVEMPSAETLTALHADGLRLARGRMLTSLLGLVPLAVAAAVAPFYPFVFPLIFLSFPVLAWTADATYEWFILQRSDPAAQWRRDRREQTDEAAGIVEHQARAAVLRPVVSLALLATIVAVAAVQFLGPGVRASVPVAALVKPAVWDGELWRLLSAGLLHGSLMHLLANAGALIALSEMVEIYDRRARVPLAFVVGVLGGNLASTLLVSAASLGASGGVLGIAGYLLGAGVGPQSAPGWLKRRLIRTLLATAMLGIAGFLFIDNAGHVGGLIAGYLAGGIAARARRSGDAQLAARLDRWGWISAALLATVAIFTTGRLLDLW